MIRSLSLPPAVIARSGGDDLIADLRKAIENPQVSITAADLSSLHSVSAAAATIGDQLDRGTPSPTKPR